MPSALGGLPALADHCTAQNAQNTEGVCDGCFHECFHHRVGRIAPAVTECSHRPDHEQRSWRPADAVAPRRHLGRGRSRGTDSRAWSIVRQEFASRGSCAIGRSGEDPKGWPRREAKSPFCIQMAGPALCSMSAASPTYWRAIEQPALDRLPDQFAVSELRPVSGGTTCSNRVARIQGHQAWLAPQPAPARWRRSARRCQPGVIRPQVVQVSGGDVGAECHLREQVQCLLIPGGQQLGEPRVERPGLVPAQACRVAG
jgi:hypothetical protein